MKNTLRILQLKVSKVMKGMIDHTNGIIKNNKKNKKKIFLFETCHPKIGTRLICPERIT